MKKFAVHVSEYMGDEADMRLDEAEDLRALLLELLEYDDEGQTLDDLKDEFDMGNGDGQPYVTVLDVETGEKVLG